MSTIICSLSLYSDVGLSLFWNKKIKVDILMCFLFVEFMPVVIINLIGSRLNFGLLFFKGL